MRRQLFIALVLVALFATTALAAQVHAHVKSDDKAVEPFVHTSAVPSRDEVMSCAQNWVDRAVPYCQCNGAAECCGTCPYCGTFRCDCSGYVAFCLNLPAGLNTNSLPSHGTAITKDELKKGDFIDCPGEHVVFFAGWTDSTKTKYVVYQEPGCHTDTVHHAYKSVTTYPFGTNICFKPFRRVGFNATRTVSATQDDTMASATDLQEAFLNAPYLVGHTEAESAKVIDEVREHGEQLGYFTF